MTLLRRLLARLRLPLRICQTPHPDCLNLREWADLPVHHPRCD
jgi:hypothetical protein